MTKEIMAIYRTFWSGMHHYEGGGGGKEFLERYVIFFFKTSRGARFFHNLEKLFSASFAMQDYFFLNFPFVGFFVRFLDSPPPQFTFLMVHP